MIPLRELEAKFFKLGEDPACHYPAAGLADAQMLMFLCPKCYVANGGRVGTHMVMCWFADRGVSPDRKPGPGRWRPTGTGVDDITFVGPDPCSVLLTSGCCWHGFVVNGKAG